MPHASAFLSIVVATLVANGSIAEAQHPTFEAADPRGVYGVGDTITWTATLDTDASTTPGMDRRYTYVVRQDGGSIISSGTLDLTSGDDRIVATLAEPGMLLVEVTPTEPDSTFGDRSTGGPGRIRLAAAVAPTEIRPAEPKPRDFDSFWTAQIEKLAAIPMEPVVTRGESGVVGVEYATIRMNNIEGAHIYGQIARPSGEGPFPAIVIYQWASPPYPLQREWVTDRAAEGWLALNIEPHDVPGDMPQAFYDALPTRIKRYATIGQHSREESYFLRMYLGAYRAVEYMAGRPDWNGETLVVMGTSMGGQQSFVTAGLNESVTDLIVHVPAGADVTAALHGRAPSYPTWDVTRPEVLETARYFDAANFASHITARSLVSIGFIDDVSTPTGIWSVFNQIQGPKEAVLMRDAPHNHLATAEQQRPYTERSESWLHALRRGEDPTVAPLP